MTQPGNNPAAALTLYSAVCSVAGNALLHATYRSVGTAHCPQSAENMGSVPSRPLRSRPGKCRQRERRGNLLATTRSISDP